MNNSNFTTGTCSLTGGPGTYALTGSGCLTGGSGATGNLIGSPYKTPYAIHTTGGVQHAFNEHWLVSADYVHEQGNHGYRGFPYTSGTNLLSPLIPATDTTDQPAVVPNVNVFESDNRSSYNGLMLHLQGNMQRFNLVANYTFSKAQTWGCLLGELFDYVDGVCPKQPGQPNAGFLNAFGPGDYGPSGEDVRHRFVLAGTVHIPGGFELSTVNQVESARPITITNANNTDRIYVNGAYTSLDEFRGTPYIQSDLRLTRPLKSKSVGRSIPSSSSSTYSTAIIRAPTSPSMWRSCRFRGLRWPRSSYRHHQCHQHLRPMRPARKPRPSPA